MFEYLMPQLVMPSYEHTLLDQTCGAAVAPGRSTTAGSAACPGAFRNPATTPSTRSLNYQYRAFGVPGLGLKRGLGEDLVVAPYASALALMVAPEAACQNLQRLAALGFAGQLRLLRGHRLHPGPPTARRRTTPSCARSWRTTRA
jgi:cyclic beta-1,2-glucan synthetase